MKQIKSADELQSGHWYLIKTENDSYSVFFENTKKYTGRPGVCFFGLSIKGRLAWFCNRYDLWDVVNRRAGVKVFLDLDKELNNERF